MLQLTPEQEMALQALQTFFESPDERVFVLTGPAGSGKTTLVQRMVQWLKDNGRYPVLLASTGRAAKVLSDKAGLTATTVHSHIYVFDELQEAAQGEGQSGQGQLRLNFEMRYQEYFGLDAVHIVDEASMLSHEVSVGDYAARFGTGSVLDDLMTSTNPYKIVFVGDPCQLPPVARTPFSAALDVAFLSRTYGVKGSSFVLREILRQQSGNEILKMAGYYRDGILSEAFLKYPKIKISQTHTGHAVLYSDEESLIQTYVARIQQHGLNAQVMLTNSNWKSFEVNNKIRAALGKTAPLAVGDLLMVAQNNYLVPLTNGDQVEVLDIQGTEKHAGMQLLQVVVRSLANGQSYETKLIADFLHHSEASLPKEMMQQLLIEFHTRMRRLGIAPKTEAYNKAMRSDPHLNALRAKFGYCITCHKSQGGEWQEVFLLVHKSVFAMRDAALYRWFYTALTRAREKLHLHRDWWVVQY